MALLLSIQFTAPVDLALLKQHARVEHDDEDELLQLYLDSAAEWAEEYCRRSFVRRQHVYQLDGFPEGDSVIELPRSPLVSVESIRYMDAQGEEQTLDPALYRVDTGGMVGRVVLRSGECWPRTIEEPATVTVRFTAGYEDAPSKVKRAVLIMAAHAFEYREPIVVGTIVSDVPYSAVSLLGSERVLTVY